MTTPEQDSAVAFTVRNLATATFECTFGRGCDGLCCRNGRPPVYFEESLRIAEVLPRLFAHLRASARKRIRRDSFLTRRRWGGAPKLRVVEGWCIFFNRGCTLHRLGVEDGDKYLYKPAVCALFPIDRDGEGRWRVRQQDSPDESWDLFCLDSNNSRIPASISLSDEVALARRMDADDRRRAGG